MSINGLFGLLIPLLNSHKYTSKFPAKCPILVEGDGPNLNIKNMPKKYITIKIGINNNRLIDNKI